MIKIGDKVDDRFRILSRVATGGMADIYEANDLIMKRVVCLKVMKEALLRDPRNVERFANETAVAVSFAHPNIVRVYGRGFVEGRPYMATEFVKGQTLRDKLNFAVTLSLSDACEVMLQLTSAIGYIHNHGLVHRDIKPDNLFYLSDGTVKVSDFGISIPIGTLPAGDAIQGTIYYCAPEVLLGKPAEISNDIYSMGVVFFELSKRKIPVQHAGKGGQTASMAKASFLPIKINSAGVIPVIFASSILMAPSVIASFFSAEASQAGWLQIFNYSAMYPMPPIDGNEWSMPWGLLIYITLIVVFTFFYSELQMNPEQMADNFQKNGSYIPGIRPGKETEKYVRKVLNRVTCLGAIGLAFISALPVVLTLSGIFGNDTSLAIGGTGMIIVVGVAIELNAQIDGLLAGKSFEQVQGGM